MKIYKIRKVYPLENMVLGVLFGNGVFKKYDLSRLIPEIPVFKKLKNRKLFCKAKVDFDGAAVVWNSEIDLSEYELYKNGVEWKNPPKEDIPVSNLVEQFRALRKKAKRTQQEIADKTGIKQSCIARMENGGRTPNLETLLQLGKALGYTLQWKRQ